jgi:hypothetical protein
MSEGEKAQRDPDLLWGCFVNWVETLEKIEERKGQSDPVRTGHSAKSL